MDKLGHLASSSLEEVIVDQLRVVDIDRHCCCYHNQVVAIASLNFCRNTLYYNESNTNKK